MPDFHAITRFMDRKTMTYFFLDILGQAVALAQAKVKQAG
jgi:hypothetical protein